MEIVKNTVAGCQMRITMASNPVTLGLLNNERKILELLSHLADQKTPMSRDAEKFLKSIGYYKLLEEKRRLVELIEKNPGIVEREAREEAARDKDGID